MKKLTLLLWLFSLVLLPSFSSADIIVFPATDTTFRYTQISNWQTISFPNTNNDLMCFQADAYCNKNWYSECGTVSSSSSSAVRLAGWWDWFTCTRDSNISLYASRSISYYYYLLVSETAARYFFPNYTSLECQTEYSLIPVSSVDQNYCTTNNLCPSCPSCPDTPVWSWGISNVYINNILHVGAPNIIMNIPEEIDWDYEYTQWWNNMNIDVVWYNQDTEYIEWLIDVQNYKPTSDDFSNTFWLFSSYWWLLIATLFVILIFYFIKKLF